MSLHSNVSSGLFKLLKSSQLFHKKCNLCLLPSTPKKSVLTTSPHFNMVSRDLT